MTSLEFLDLSDNETLNITDPKAFDHLTNLNTLYLDNGRTNYHFLEQQILNNARKAREQKASLEATTDTLIEINASHPKIPFGIEIIDEENNVIIAGRENKYPIK